MYLVGILKKSRNGDGKKIYILICNNLNFITNIAVMLSLTHCVR